MIRQRHRDLPTTELITILKQKVRACICIWMREVLQEERCGGRGRRGGGVESS